MKILINITDRQLISRIEALRISNKIFSSAFSELTELLPENDRPLSFDEVVFIYRKAWEAIDFGHRFYALALQTKGLKHADPRMKSLIVIGKPLADIRNLVQHLTSELLNLPENPAPILGAITWASPDGTMSWTTSAGYMPAGTTVVSAVLDVRKMRILTDIQIQAVDHSLNLSALSRAIAAANEQLEEMLEENNWLGAEDSVPSRFSFDVKALVKP